MKVANCARCNKEIEVEKMKDLEAVKCSHCNQVHVVSKKNSHLIIYRCRTINLNYGSKYFYCHRLIQS